MSIRKTLLLVLIFAVFSLGLTGCKQKSEHPTSSDQPTTEMAPAEQPPAEHPTEEKTEEATPEHPTTENPTEHPTEHPE